MGKGGVSVTVPVSALGGILGRVVTYAPRGSLGVDARTRVTGKPVHSMVDVCQMVAVSARVVGVVMIARDARRATLGITVKHSATRSIRVGAMDVAGQTGLVSALKLLQDLAVTCVQRALGAKGARSNARLAQRAWMMEGVLGMEAVYVSLDTLVRGARCAILACVGRAVT